MPGLIATLNSKQTHGRMSGLTTNTTEPIARVLYAIIFSDILDAVFSISLWEY